MGLIIFWTILVYFLKKLQKKNLFYWYKTCGLGELDLVESQKVTKKIYSIGIKHVDWENLIWLNEVLLAKTLVL